MKLQSILDNMEADDYCNRHPTFNLQNTSFVLFIDCPETRIADCKHIIEAIGLRSLEIQVITNLSLLQNTFQHINDIVSTIMNNRNP